MTRETREKLMKADIERKLLRKRSFHQRLFRGQAHKPAPAPRFELLRGS